MSICHPERSHPTIVTVGIRVRSAKQLVGHQGARSADGLDGGGEGRSCGFLRPLGGSAFTVLVRAAGQCRQPSVLQRWARQAGKTLDRSPGLRHSSAAGFFLGAL